MMPRPNCYRCQHGATCDACGKLALPAHMPVNEPGFFCTKCCPVCNEPKVRSVPAPAEAKR